MKKLLYLPLVIFLLLPSTWLFAEDISSLDEVVVSATKTKEQRRDISNSVIVKDDLDMDTSPALGIGDFLGGELGIDWRTRGNYGGAAQEIQIRGMGADGTQVLVNGLTVNSPSLGSADVGHISTGNIRKIEVVKGSGSVLYGSGAMGGTLNVMTKNPKQDQIDLSIITGYGSEGTWELGLQNGMFVTKTLGYYVTAGMSETQGFRDNSDSKTKDMSLKLLFDKGELFKLSLYGDYFISQSGRPGPKPPEGVQPFFVGGTELYNGNSANLLNRVDNENYHLVLAMDGHPFEWLSYHVQSDYSDMLSEDDSRYYSATTPDNLSGSESEVANKVLGHEGHVTLRPTQQSSFLLGIQHKNYEWENQSTSLDGFGVATPVPSGDATLHTTGYFTEVQYRPSNYIKGTLGLRYEDHSTFGSDVLPRLGLVANVTDTTAIKFNTGKHFKAPTPNDLFWPLEYYGGDSGAEGNNELKPETGLHSDLGIEQSLASNKIFISLGYFCWDIEDKIEWVPDVNYFYRPENLSQYSAKGFEAGVRFGPFSNTRVSFNYTYTDAKEKTPGGVERKSRYSAYHYLHGTVNHWFDFGLDLSTVVRYTGKRPAAYGDDNETNPTEFLDAYWTVDVKAKQEFLDHWSVSLQVNNLFDKSYDTYVQNFRDQEGVSTLSTYPGAGSSFYATLEYTF